MFVFVPGVFLKIKILQRDMLLCMISTEQE